VSYLSFNGLIFYSFSSSFYGYVFNIFILKYLGNVFRLIFDGVVVSYFLFAWDVLGSKIIIKFQKNFWTASYSIIVFSYGMYSILLYPFRD